MMNITLTPLLAIDAGGIELVIIVILGIIGWIVKLVNKQNQAAPPPQQRPVRRPANEKLNREIDVFLQEISGRKKPDEPVQVEVVPEAELRKRRAERPQLRPAQKPAPRPLQRQQQRPQQPPQPARPIAPASRVRPGQEIAERHIESSRLGSGVQSHVSQYLAKDRIEQEVRQHLKHEVEQSVEQHLGQFGATPAAAVSVSPARASGNSRGVVALLRDPEGMRQAILVNEVLGKPLGLRKR